MHTTHTACLLGTGRTNEFARSSIMDNNATSSTAMLTHAAIKSGTSTMQLSADAMRCPIAATCLQHSDSVCVAIAIQFPHRHQSTLPTRDDGSWPSASLSPSPSSASATKSASPSLSALPLFDSYADDIGECASHTGWYPYGTGPSFRMLHASCIFSSSEDTLSLVSVMLFTGYISN